MTCGKCERLIKEAIAENLPEAKNIEVFREEGYATFGLTNNPNFPISLNANAQDKVLSSIHNLVNGKFKAAFVFGE